MPNVLSKIVLVAALALSSSVSAQDSTGAPSDGWSVFRPSLNEVEDGRVRDEEAPDIVYDFESGTLDSPIRRPEEPERRAPVDPVPATNNEPRDRSAPTMGDGASISEPSAPDMLPGRGENNEAIEENNPVPWSTTPDIEELADEEIRERVQKVRERARRQERRRNKKNRRKEKNIQERWEKRMAARERRKEAKRARKNDGDFQEDGDIGKTGRRGA